MAGVYHARLDHHRHLVLSVSNLPQGTDEGMEFNVHIMRRIINFFPLPLIGPKPYHVYDNSSLFEFVFLMTFWYLGILGFVLVERLSCDHAHDHSGDRIQGRNEEQEKKRKDQIDDICRWK